MGTVNSFFTCVETWERFLNLMLSCRGGDLMIGPADKFLLRPNNLASRMITSFIFFILNQLDE